MLKVGDKVKLIKGNPFGKIGRIKYVLKASRADTSDLPLEDNFFVVADDGTEFSGFEDELEKLE